MNKKYKYQQIGLGLLLACGWIGCDKNSSTSVLPSASTSPTQDSTKPTSSNTQQNVTTSSPSASGVVARVGDKELTTAELYNRPDVHDALSGAIEDWMNQTILEKAAKDQGKPSVEAFVDAKFPKATEEEAKALFEQFKGSPQLQGKTFEDVKEQLIMFATQKKRQGPMHAWMQEERKNLKATNLLPEPVMNVAAEGPSKGAKDAKVTIVEFSDFQCPHCGKGRQVMDEVAKKYGDKVRIVFRDFPLEFHDKAKKAAEAGQCAEKQGKFWALHDFMFSNQDKLSVESLKTAAKDLGLNTEQFNKCLDSGETAAMVAANMEAGKKVGVRGTPAFFVNGVMLSGAQPLEKFSEKIDKALAGN